MQQGSILSFFKKSGSSRPGQPYPDASRASSHSRPKSTKQHRGPDRRRNMDLKKVADETKAVLPQILATEPNFDATASSIHDLNDLAPLNPKDCPGFVLRQGDAEAGKKGARIKVWDMDTFDAALKLDPNYKMHTHLGTPGGDTDNESSDTESTISEDLNGPQPSDKMDTSGPLDSSTQKTATINTTPTTRKPVAVLNLASERSPGGGWQNGALAQEECLCYRSTLPLSLHKTHYPLPPLSALHTPSVLIIRSSMPNGHTLLTPTTPPANLPVVAVISVAALRRPDLTPDRLKFEHDVHRTATKKKIRVSLRVAASKGHTKLVLGALGCGVFGNPPGEVAACFLEVLHETEFQGGWWEEVVFAVLDNVKGGGKDGDGNFGFFFRGLDGLVV
ncbi:hypothetical protein P153DRAFT_339086 [Dothidotthia symphoricarpi CBS 119687]|uniref:Microbial-type PARG catalytic domain-containing protein n=1 Tax=Dothidotthia symphoricarpi CBS 119687 TaxID=1392245 RepID=A0A6A6AFZ8_9PLEO|nr:uncharacterized protein P153DRAFT_339086 [Dothidotthia symphoricarpi CBS 119687]KAF2129864.1 hypothetical protein P153DRAFT_339086 [Dothidotthia symphoricarpi CBS 119687]